MKILKSGVMIQMARKILVGVDLSKMSESLIAYSHSIAHRLNDEVIYIHVLPRLSSLWRGYEPWIPPQIGDEVKQIAHKKISYWIQKAEDQFKDLPVHEHKILIEEGSPGEVIIQKAKEENVSLIIVAYKGHSTMEHILIGSTTTTIARHAPCSVLIYRPGFEIM
ncbi:MAG TPA: universal stress protein [Acetomicrobium flavidum]|uniref:Universal stress protein UspA-like protein n=3 Tax=Acetomicrobium TaxID=49894 RepID=I4BYD5_ACEMN|nr:universal stress protein [Acetomicrobium mobile]SIN72000.1 Nucleotide-binding universal stress protein, UspA family [Acetomicrobium flavidum]AFM22292.1 universal stress protein UspA-like protein [Acetomicrobium mobile DSM 13181]HOJ82008.1 universal stress protein [Acetomicrobium flavidum]HOM31006.1 universal stress protein [Acetomicrobium flavidum]HOP87704.1 universal stress protein [Acetomicrobium flavidum]